MQAFFTFIAGMVTDIVGLYFGLPFMDDISLGDIVVGIMIFSLLIGAFVSQLRSFSLSNEAHQANYHDRINSFRDGGD